ncbi:MAG: DNA replication/repair protein RecF [Lysobacteraceae bacterium]
MQLVRLRLARFRGFEAVELQPAPRINLITGGNGAGKTSLLEAAHLLANGRSFRGRVRDGLVRAGATDLEVFGEWTQADGRSRRAGLRHSGREWQGRLDGEPVSSLVELCSALAVLTFEPGSHALIAGGAEQRRRFVDWALFHVEPEFLPLWRRYSRALKQRNSLLKTRPQLNQLTPWTIELAEAGEPVSRLRSLYLQRLQPLLASTTHLLLPEVGAVELFYQPGWQRETESLVDAIQRSNDRDVQSGHTTLGPHRADWVVAFERLPGREALSRGQEKLLALACTLAQALAFAEDRGEWPILALDDLASELDRTHFSQVMAFLSQIEAQILITGTELPMLAANHTVARFHVEQGSVSALL